MSAVDFEFSGDRRLWLNGHQGPALMTSPDTAGGDEAALVRRIRRQVAEEVTQAGRTHQTQTGQPQPVAERQALTHRLISQALDALAAAEMGAGRPPLHPAVESRVQRAVADGLLRAGGLQPWLEHPQVEDIVANGCDEVFVRFADATVEKVAPVADSDADLVELVRTLAARSGLGERRWDRAAPLLNLQLPDGSRLNAVLDVSRRPSLSIRRHRFMTLSLDDLHARGSISRAIAALLTAAVRARLNIIVGGPTGAGKTTFLRALAAAIPPQERLVTIEDTFELGFDQDREAHPNVVALQAREANVEGEGAVDLSMLFRNALRMVPSRVFVGEVRGDEVIPLLNAMSQGNDGSLSSIHASSSAGVFAKLALYAAQSPQRLEQAVTNLHIAEGLHLVVQLHQRLDGQRLVTSIREVTGADGLQVNSNEIFQPDAQGRAVPGAPASTGLTERLVWHGFDTTLLHHGEGGWR